MTSSAGSMGVSRRGGIVAVAVLLLVTTGALGWAIGYWGPAVAAVLPLLILGFVVLNRPAVGLYAVACTIPFEAMVMFPGGSTISKALAAVVVAAWAFRKLLRRESWRDVLHAPIFAPCVVFLGFALASRLWATYTHGVNMAVARLVMMIGFGLLVMDLTRRWTQARWVARMLIVGALVGAFLSVWESYDLGARRAGELSGLGPNGAALLFVCILPFAFALLRSAEEDWRWRTLALVYVPASAIAVILTYSRMGLLMGGALLLMEYVLTLRARTGRLSLTTMVAAGALAFAVLVPKAELQERISTIGPYLEATALGGETGSAEQTSGRGFHLRMAWAAFKDHPWVGLGYWNFGEYSINQYQFSVFGSSDLFHTPRSAHSSFLRILADLGLVGMILWLALLFVTGRELWIAWRRTRHRPGSLEYNLVRAVVFVFLLEQAYGFYAELEVKKIFWLVLGFAVALRRLSKPPVQNNEDGPYTREAIPVRPAKPTREGAGITAV